jgi:hypothetical protein
MSFSVIWLHSSRYRKSTSCFRNQDLNLISYFSTLDKDHTTLYPSNAISLSADFCNVYFIFFAHFELNGISRTSVEACTTVVATPNITTTSPVSFFISKSCSWWRSAVVFMSRMRSYMRPIFRIRDCIFANCTICITTFMISYEIGMNPLVALAAFVVSEVIFLRNIVSIY